MRSSILTIPSDQRAMVVGRTGSGKSTLARAILLPLRYVLVIDTKYEFELPEATIVGDPSKLSKMSKRHERPIIYRAEDRFDSLDYYNRVLEWAFARGNSTVYIDEVFDLMKGTTVVPMLKKVLKQGRSKGVRCVISTQRPRYIPIDILSESERFYMFDLLLRDDKKRMAEVMGQQVLGDLPIPYTFWYNNIKQDVGPRVCKLKIGR